MIPKNRMKKILQNIENTWQKTSELSTRISCLTHVRTNDSWRYVVSTHQMKVVDICITIFVDN